MRAPEEERLARAALSRMTEPGATGVLGLVTQLGPVATWRQLVEERAYIDVAEEDRRPGEDARLRAADLDPARDLARAADQGIRFVVPGDEEWPDQLSQLAGVEIHGRGGVPVGLWVRGPMSLGELQHSAAVVGSRGATTYGADIALEIGGTLAKAGVVTVSGAAIGIDYAAHDGALKAGGRTVAVLAGGVDRPYPARHAALIRHLAAEHAVVSEAPPGSASHQLRFLGRNRLIAALTAGTVVVEAAIRSGALNTARWADSLSRAAMGVPGPIGSALSQGVHERIREGAMTLVSNGAQVLELVGAPGEHLLEVPWEPPKPRDSLSIRQRQILDAVPVAEPVLVDSIARTAGIGLKETYGSLQRLEKREFVVRLGSGWLLGPRALES